MYGLRSDAFIRAVRYCSSLLASVGLQRLPAGERGLQPQPHGLDRMHGLPDRG